MKIRPPKLLTNLDKKNKPINKKVQNRRKKDLAVQVRLMEHQVRDHLLNAKLCV
jgi:hypothetical protein